jgi:hypothetical protein
MAMLSWNEREMVFGLFFLLVRVKMVERKWEEVEKCDVEVGPGVVLFGVYEKRGEKIMVMSFYFF